MPSLLLVLVAAAWLALFAAARRRRHASAAWARLSEDVAATGVLGAATVAFFWRLLIPGNWMPEGGGDMASFLLPMAQYAAGSLRAGQLPLWNPHLYAGAPFAADIQSALFYPLNLAAYALVPRITYGWLEALSALHFLVAGGGMYLLVRYLRPGGPPAAPVPALLAGLAFGFSDLFVTHFGNLNLIAVAAWLPWVFLCFHRALRAPHRRSAACWALPAGLFLGLAGLGGHAQPLLFLLLVLGLDFLAAVVELARHRATLTSTVAMAGRALAVLAVGLGLAAAALLPAVEMVGHTRRAALSVAEATAYSLSPELLVGLFSPGVFGRGMQRYWGPWPRVETGYVGVAVVLLAVLCVVIWRRDARPLRGVPVGFLAVLAALALALALGGNTPVYGWLHRALPGAEGLRAPARYILLLDLALAALAGFGLDALLRLPRETARVAVRRSLVAFAAAALVLALPGLWSAAGLLGDGGAHVQDRVASGVLSTALAITVAVALGALLTLFARGRLSGTVTSLGALTLVAVELFAAGSSLDRIQWDPVANLTPPAMTFLEGDPGLYRIEVRPEVWGWWSPSAALAAGEHDVGGVYNPLVLADYQLFWESLTDRETRLYDFLNAKYVVAQKDFALPWDTFVPVYDADPNVNIYLNLESMPRAVVVHDVISVDSHDAAWQAVHDQTFDPARSVVVEGGEPIVRRSDTPPQVDVTGYRSNAVALRATLADEGYLVLADVFYPGWRVTVDGREADVQRANYAFRAVRLPPGEHEIAFSFQPSTWRIGAAISLAAGLVIIVGFVMCARTVRRSRSGSGPAESSPTA